MALDGEKKPLAERDRVNINPNAQAALEKLIAQKRQTKMRQRVVRSIIGLLFLLWVVPNSFDFYCRHIIGTNFETMFMHNYPHFTDKTIRAAVITDELYLNIFGPVLNMFRDKDDIECRRAVIELGMEVTGEGERDSEKIHDLRGNVTAALVKSPTFSKSALVFAVYELPPQKDR